MTTQYLRSQNPYLAAYQACHAMLNVIGRNIDDLDRGAMALAVAADDAENIGQWAQSDENRAKSNSLVNLYDQALALHDALVAHQNGDWRNQ